VEREQVRAALPEVTVIDLPDSPFEYANALRESPVFERLSLSSEDRERNAMYAVQRDRAKDEQEFHSKEDFYRFLEQKLEIAPLSSQTLGRIAQLTQKTNQFNLTTRRYTEQQISALCEQDGWRVVGIRVRDRFGDQGLVGVAITQDEGKTCEIDTLVMSCRVIGRTVETAFLSALAKFAIQRGCEKLTGHFLPTKKNAPAKDFYSQHGFQLHSEDGSGSRWVADLTQHTLSCPGWIELNFVDGENN
jgi:FkbH-like protein